MTHAPAVATQAPAVAHAGGVHAVAPAHAPAEREADRFAQSFASADPGPAWSFGDVPVHADDGARLGRRLEARLGAALDADLSGVRLHDDDEAADLARRAGAEAVTIGHDISFAPGRHQPGTREGVRRLAHEVAHAARHADRDLAHRDGTAPVVPATTLAGLPEADRKNIQVVTTTAVNVTGLAAKFATKKPGSASMTSPLPANTTVAADASAAKVDSHGLANVAAALVTEADVSPAPLPENGTITIELDLSTFGGIKGPYRFTYHAPPAAKGQAAVKRVLVEQLAAASPPAGATKPADPKPGEKPAADPVADKLKAASITYSGYSTAEEQSLRAAIALVPAAHLSLISGLTFVRKAKDPADPKVAGKYFPKDDATQGVAKANTIVIFDKAFEASTAVSVEGGVETSMASREILHEIGHAVDLRRLQVSNDDVDAAQTAVNAAASDKFTSKDEKDRFDAANKALVAAKKKLKDLRTASGTQSVEVTENNKQVSVDKIGKDTTDFRDAVKKDGKNVSKYAEKDWQDSFAEAYSLYLSEPSELLVIRPATHAYFTKAYPR